MGGRRWRPFVSATALVIGGALAGRAIDSRGERATGTIPGGAAGALLGREVEKELRCR